MASDLISRSAAIGCLGNSPSQICMPWSEVERMLRELPAVDAIPVEWLEEHDSEGDEYGRWYITVVEALSIWQKEQEAR